jgi:hypothetical protein
LGGRWRRSCVPFGTTSKIRAALADISFFFTFCAGVTQDQLLAFLKNNEPPSAEPVVVASNPMAPVFEASAVFYLAQAHASAIVPFQLHISLPKQLVLDQLSFDSVRVALSDGSEVVVRHNAGGGGSTSVPGLRLVKVAEGKQGEASLSWAQDARTLVVSGCMRIDLPGPISVSPLYLALV